MNTIRRIQTGEPASQRRSLGGEALQPERVIDTEARAGDVSVVGGSGTGKDDVVNAGELPGEDAARCPAEVRAAIVARKSGNADGAKGGRKWKQHDRSSPLQTVSSIALRLERHGYQALGSQAVCCCVKPPRRQHSLPWLGWETTFGIQQRRP